MIGRSRAHSTCRRRRSYKGNTFAFRAPRKERSSDRRLIRSDSDFDAFTVHSRFNDAPWNGKSSVRYVVYFCTEKV